MWRVLEAGGEGLPATHLEERYSRRTGKFSEPILTWKYLLLQIRRQTFFFLSLFEEGKAHKGRLSGG